MMYLPSGMGWLILLIVFLVVEGACPIHLVSLWFAVGAVVAMIAQALGAALWLQVLLFLLVSAALLLALWPLTIRVFNANHVATNVDAVIGSTGLVTADIDNIAAQGQVKLGAMEWSARSSSGENIPKGTKVKVDKVEGVKLFVSVEA